MLLFPFVVVFITFRFPEHLDEKNPNSPAAGS